MKIKIAMAAGLLLFSLVARAANELPANAREVTIKFDNERRTRIAYLVEDGTTEERANGDSRILVKRYVLKVNIAQPPLEPIYKTLDVPITSATVADVDALTAQFPRPREGGQPIFYRGLRTTGGFSPAEVERPYLEIQGQGVDRGRVNRVGVDTAFRDYDRVGGKSKADPVLNTQGKFTAVTYTKPFFPSAWTGEGEARRASFTFLQGRYEYHDPASTGLKQQRYLLDFGKHPTLDRQLIYRVYVERFEGEDAILIGPDQLQALERARAGEKVRIRYLTVPRAMLRLAGDAVEGHEDKTGERALLRAGQEFVEDQGIAKEKEWGMDRFVRANRWNSDRTVDVLATGNLQGTLNSLQVAVSADRATLRLGGSQVPSAQLGASLVPEPPPAAVQPPPPDGAPAAKPARGPLAWLCRLFKKL